MDIGIVTVTVLCVAGVITCNILQIAVNPSLMAMVNVLIGAMVNQYVRGVVTK